MALDKIWPFLKFKTFNNGIKMQCALLESANIPSNEEISALHKKKRRRVKNMFFLLVLFIVITFGVVMFLKYVLWKDDFNPSSTVELGRIGAVASEHGDCSRVGINILKSGGSAVDGAIATALCVGTLNSFASGIGGGGFMLIRTPNGTTEMIDFREKAPILSTRSMFNEHPGRSQEGGLSVGIPGELRGFELAWKRYGKLPWSKLFEPSITIAKKFTVGPFLAKMIKSQSSFIMKYEGLRKQFAPEGELLEEGNEISRFNFSKTLTKIAEKGANVFYQGDMAESLVDFISENGGIATLEDFKNYTAIVRPTISTFYHGRKIITGPLPTSGHILLSILNILEGYRLNIQNEQKLNIHRMVEAMKYGFAQRSELGDSDFVNIKDRLEEFLDKDLASQIRRNISDNCTYSYEHYNPKYEPINSGGTTHISVMKEGFGVSLTSSINFHFGSKLLHSETGILLNNQMDDFSKAKKSHFSQFIPSVNNFVEPGKRPLSSATPVVVENNGNLEWILGGAGGTKIITGVLEVLINSLDYGMDILDSIVAPRFHHELFPEVLTLESDFNYDLAMCMQEFGHQIRFINQSYLSVVNGVNSNDDGSIVAYSDPRKNGRAAAY
jgi:gamma-glutamyltranspeptidase/glutathione hydrolase/leukotriene-C4 hydrolase